MNYFLILFFLVVAFFYNSAKAKLVCTDDSDITIGPCQNASEVHVHQESFKIEAVNRPKDMNEDPALSTLLEDAEQMFEEWHLFVSNLKKNVPSDKNSVGVAEENEHSDTYHPKSLKWATQSMNLEQEVNQSPEDDSFGRKDNNANTPWNKSEDNFTFDLARKLTGLFKLYDIDLIACVEAFQQARTFLLETKNKEMLYSETVRLEKLSQMYAEDKRLITCAKAVNDMKEILLVEYNVDHNSESQATFQEPEGPEDNWDKNKKDVEEITSKFATPKAEQLNRRSSFMENFSPLSVTTLQGDVDEAKLELFNIDDNQIVLNRHRRGNTDATKSTQADLNSLFKGDVGGTKITQLAEGGGMTLTSTTLLTTSPGPVSSKINVASDKEKQSSTHLVEGGGMPLNDAHTSSISGLATNVTFTTVSQEHISPMGPAKELNNTADSDTNSHKTVPRKGAEAGKIVGRKGVEDLTADDVPSAFSSENKSTNNSNSTTSNASQSIDNKGEVIESNPPLKKKPHAKPLTLTDKTSFNKTTVPHDPVPSQSDYVVPIVVLILLVPLVTILGTLLYKKGSEYWSRRHYRRMDFLIDGMYHD